MQRIVMPPPFRTQMCIDGTSVQAADTALLINWLASTTGDINSLDLDLRLIGAFSNLSARFFRIAANADLFFAESERAEIFQVICRIAERALYVSIPTYIYIYIFRPIGGFT